MGLRKPIFYLGKGLVLAFHNLFGLGKKRSHSFIVQEYSGQTSDWATYTSSARSLGVKDDKLQKLTSKEIVALREQLKQSQAVFARFLNVSVKAVQAWEAGTRNPSGAALKLLSIARKDPQILVS